MDCHSSWDLCGPPAVLWVTPWMNLPPQQHRKLWCVMWNGSRTGTESQAGRRSSWTPRNPETWTEPDATLVLFLSSLFSPILLVLLLCPFPHCPPVHSPSDIWIFCSPAEAGLNPDPSFFLLSPCALFLSPALFYSSFPQSCHMQSFIQNIFIELLLHLSALASLLFFLSPLQCPYKVRGALSEQERVSLPWFWCDSGGLPEHPAQPMHPPAGCARSLRGRCALTCAACTAGSSSEARTHFRGNIWMTL